VNVINLSVGEPDFMTPDHIKEAAKRAIDENFTRYTPVPGYLSLRQAIVKKLKEENNIDFTAEQIVVSNGAKQALCDCVLSIVNPGDEVIIPTPAWVSYVEMVKLAEGVPVLVPAGVESNFKINGAQLEAAITPRTRAIILCSPSNPTGSVYSKAELKELADVLAKYPDVVIIADEIYEHINFTGSFESISQFESVKDRVAIINGVSKAYAMTGWRIGYLAAPLWLAKANSKLQSQYSSGASSIAQKAAEAAYMGPQECVAEMNEAFRRRRDLVVGLLREVPGVKINNPEGAFYIFPEVSSFFGKSYNGKTINDANDLAIYLLEEAHVATVSGDAFCAPGYIRLSYATSDENIVEAIERIGAALRNLI
ncbi:MAG: pyridoxal phosphate-dependent aminotransferase, partial [Muribaculaceae bacterium]|nr:pyridoxal phosphate-dependent aminotransferase [Muribaculaceae bacterium]